MTKKYVNRGTDLEDRDEQIRKYAKNIMELARDTITIRFRFFDSAMARLKLTEKPGLLGFAIDSANIYYDPGFLLLQYVDEENIAVRAMLHMLMHNVFLHRGRNDRTHEDYWNIACDIAVENIILEMNIPAAALTRDTVEQEWISRIHKWQPKITAERLYRDFCINGISDAARKDFAEYFSMDLHETWRGAPPTEEIIMTEEEWKKISKKIQTDIKTFSKDRTGSESIESNIDETNRKKYNYVDILSHFMVTGEEMTVNDDEFDYIYYTYGLKTYGNLPLIEPLEYKEVKRVKEFVIVIDTSASCRGEIVNNFLRKTRDILKSQDSFFTTVNIHIVECDAQVQTDTKVTSDEEFEDFIKNGKLTGFGATDFRPAFQYVDYLLANGEFENLKGLIYFTDGYGIYPNMCPKYDTIFAFLGEDERRPDVPNWAIKVILEEEEYEHK